MARVRTSELVETPIASVHPLARPTTSWPGRDAAALAILAVLAALAILNRSVFDAWIARFDVHTFFVPWYAYLGSHLRAFDLPGWNPHLFSGTPFAGDPESGWMYLPAMFAFALFDVLTAFKAMLAVQIAIAGLTTYLLARALGMGPAASLVAGIAYLAGPLLQWTSYCCFVLSGCAVWMPLAFLGVELALRAERWRDRIVPWFLTGFAVSQIFAGWVGEGWLVAPLAIGAWVAYRAILSPPRAGRTFPGRLVDAVTTGAAGIGTGLALGAAGILIRLDVNAQSNLAGADYSQRGAEGILNPPWSGPHLLAQVLGAGYDHRSAALGGAVVALALLAPFIAGRRFAVPFWAGLTVVAMALTLPPGPLDRIVGLIPRFEELHSHDPWRVYTVAILGPALMAGATVESLPRWRGKPTRALLTALPLAVIAIAAAVARPAEGFIGWPPLVAAGLAMAAVALSTLASAAPGDWSRLLGRWLPLALALLVFIQPTGMELTGSWLGWPADPSWQGQWHSDPSVMATLKRDISPTDPGGAGDFLLAQQAKDGPFRYVGYGGILYPGDAARQDSYMGRRFDPGVQAILVNGRPMMLGLDEIQGYDPIELARYDQFMRAVNGQAQNYHTAYLLPPGTGSRLLDLLDVRYALVDAALPQDRPDVVALANGGKRVFANDHVVVYERQPDARRAWIVHDVRAAPRGETLAPIASGAVDPFKTAFVEGAPPETAAASGPESARVTRADGDTVSVDVTATAPGLLVLSEPYATGWQATVDGKPAPILPTDLLLRGVPIPAGEHRVELRYAPESLRIGLAISAVAGAAMLAALARAGWRRIRGGA